jgi:magnesium-protoporphyrin O-methyltransferase
MSDTYQNRRSEIGDYFDRTAADAWKRLTSDAPVSRIRATVRAGRDEMRATLLSYLPEDLGGARVLDAGCGTGAFAQLLAERGAQVVAVDLSQQMIAVARDRTPPNLRNRISFKAGDMTSPELGKFDYCVAMDSIIHYEGPDMLAVLSRLADNTTQGVAFTFAPRTTVLGIMHRVGKLFPRNNRSPAIVPQPPQPFLNSIAQATGFAPKRTHRVSKGFYISQAVELTHA